MDVQQTVSSSKQVDIALATGEIFLSCFKDPRGKLIQETKIWNLVWFWEAGSLPSFSQTGSFLIPLTLIHPPLLHVQEPTTSMYIILVNTVLGSLVPTDFLHRDLLSAE